MEEVLKKKCSPLRLTEFAINRIICLLLQWRPNVEDTAVEKAMSNVKLAIQSIVQLKWQKKRDNQNDFDQMVVYIQQLNKEILNHLFDRFIHFDDSIEGSAIETQSTIGASHIALFIHHEITRLKLPFSSTRFDFQYLLERSGHMMENLEEVQLPMNSYLPVPVVEGMCLMLPKLKKLDLLCVKIADEAMSQIASLYLEELNLSCITDRGIATLCAEDSKCKFSLLTLQIMSCKISEKFQGLILQTMSALECLCLQNFRLASLPDDIKSEPLNLRRLKYFEGTSTEMEKELEIAIYSCPVIHKLHFENGVKNFSPRILLLMSKLEYLTGLHIEGCHLENLYVIEMRWIFPQLTDLSVGYVGSGFSSGHFLSLLEMCPSLQTLRITGCAGFNDRIAHQSAQNMTEKNITELEFVSCDLLRPAGITAFLKLPTLRKCKIKYGVLKVNDFDDDEMIELRDTAYESGIKLDIRLKNAVVLVYVPMRSS